MSIEKSNMEIEVNSSNHSSQLNNASSEANDDFDHHLELKKHTMEEIASSGKWYDQKLVSFLPQYSNSMVQIVILSFVLFLCPGCFNAITGIGASGISDPTVASDANVALYSTFATIGMVGGVICNIVGAKACLIFGGTGYFMYVASLLCYSYTENAGFCIFGGAYLGCCAAVTWAAQGTIIMSYTTEDRKARAIMVFWVIFNLGAVIGSIIPLAQNMHSDESYVNVGTWVAFLVLIAAGIGLAFFLLPIDKVYKSNGTRVIAKQYPRIQDELKGLFHLLKTEPKIYFMFPMFAASNWFYTYQFNDVNAARFTIRTRSLNSLLYWLSQMIGAVILGSILDLKCFKRSTRARIGFAIVFISGMAIWGGGLKFQLGYTRESALTLDLIDLKDGAYIGPMFLYIFYGMYDAIFQNFIFWILGTLSNNPKKVALYASFYKGLQSAFAAIVWRLDALEKSYMSLFASSWGLVHGSLLIAAPLILFKITDFTLIEEDDLAGIIGDDEIKSVKSVVQEEIVEKDA